MNPAKPIRVLYVIHDARRGGVQSAMLRVISALDRTRVEPTVLFPFDGPCAAQLRSLGVKVIADGAQTPLIWRFKRFAMIPRMLELARHADVVHLNSVKLALPAIAASIAGVKTIYHLHELPDSIGATLKAAIARADCTAFCSQTCADHFATVKANKKVVLVNAVPVPAEFEKPASSSLPKILMLGSVNHEKGQDLLLDAFQLVKVGAELHFYGNVGLSARRYVENLKKRASASPLADKIFFHPPTDDVAGVLAETDVLVHTSRRESFGMVLVEAMAAGVPVIANDLGGMKEVVADGVNGYLVTPGDAAALASRIEMMLADTGLRNRMGLAGRTRVLEKFDISTRIEDYHNLYETLTHPENGR